jgi:hypothetical protein
MFGTAHYGRRTPAFDVLLLANLAPLAVHLWGQPFTLVACAYLGGNALWIWMAARAAGDDRGEDSGAAWWPSIVMTIGALAWASMSQARGTVAGGFGWDGRQYASLYWFFSAHRFWPMVPEFPFSQRVGLPWLASMLPVEPAAGFAILHIVFWLATIALFAWWCHAVLGIRPVWVQAAVLWLQVFWLSIPRATAAYGYSVDSATLFFTQLWVVLLTHRRGRWALPACALVGALFKETMLLVAVLSLGAMALLYAVPRCRSGLPPAWRAGAQGWVALALAVAAAASGKLLAARALGIPQGSELATLAKWWSVRSRYPVEEALRYGAAIAGTYGGFVLLWLSTLGRPPSRDHGWAFRPLTIVGASYLAICAFGGSDLSRFALLAFPFALPVLMRELECVPAGFATLALLLGLPASHVFDAIPSPGPGFEYPNLDLEGLYSWTMEYAHPAVVGSWLAWWLGAILLLRTLAFSRSWRLTPSSPTVSTGTEQRASRGQAFERDALQATATRTAVRAAASSTLSTD